MTHISQHMIMVHGMDARATKRTNKLRRRRLRTPRRRGPLCLPSILPRMRKLQDDHDHNQEQDERRTHHTTSVG